LHRLPEAPHVFLHDFIVPQTVADSYERPELGKIYSRSAKKARIRQE
jgi:hypothetical protein